MKNTPIRNLIILLLAGAFAGGPLACGSGENQDASENTDANANSDANADSNANSDANANGDAEDLAAMPLGLQVVDEDGLPIEGASISVDDQELLTDANGRVLIEPSLDNDRVIAQILATGYTPSSIDQPVHAAEPGQEATALVRLKSLGDPIVFDSEAPFSTTQGGVSISIDANALVDPDGNPVTGDAQVTIVDLDPTAGDLDYMPGPLRGLPEDGSDDTALLSVRMAEVTFWQNDQELQLASDQHINFDFAMPDALVAGYSEGDMIPFWYFDPQQARWIQDGECTVGAGAQSIACSASHLTWWNVDKPIDTRNCVNITVVDAQTGDPIPGASLTGNGVDFQGMAAVQGLTDADGLTCMDFMLDGSIDVNALHADYFLQQGGTLTVTGNSDVSSCEGVGTCLEATIELSNASTCLSGHVLDEDDAPVENAHVFGLYPSSAGTQFTSAQTNADGSYCLNAPLNSEVHISTTVEGVNAQTTYAPQSISSDTMSCGDDSCVDIDPLILSDSNPTCIQGAVEDYDGNAIPNTPIYIYTGPVNRVCDGTQTPYDWGQVIAEGSTDANGDYAIDIDLSFAGDIYISAGDCHPTLGQECLNWNNQTFDLQAIPASVADGGCQDAPTFQMMQTCFE